MGFSFRKSFRAGPVRFNLSKSGLGVSTGVRGLRIGTGPRGAYISGGRSGLYFREQLSTPRAARTSSSSVKRVSTGTQTEPPTTSEHARAYPTVRPSIGGVFLMFFGALVLLGAAPNASWNGILIGIVILGLGLWRFWARESLRRRVQSLTSNLTRLSAHSTESEYAAIRSLRLSSPQLQSRAWRDVYERHYASTVAATLEDGIDQGELSRLLMLGESLGLPTERRRELHTELLKSVMWQMMADLEVSVPEEALAHEIAFTLGIPEADLVQEWAAMRQFVSFRELEGRVLPAIEPGIKLQRGETCHHVTQGALMDMKTVRTYVVDGERQREQELVTARAGTIYITSKRILIVGDGTTAILHEKILDIDIDCDDNLVTVTKDGRQKPLYLRTGDAIFCGKLIERLSEAPTPL